MRRFISMLLALVMVFTAIPWAAMAEENQGDAAVDTGEITVEGTNGFGNLLSAEIVEAQEEQTESYEGGYTVTDLVIEGNTATVTYDSLGEANLVVALYTEDGMQLLTSAYTTVTADNTEATVTFSGDMPDYFMASAYLVDTYDFSPLCEAYDTPMYTKDMQELLASTVEDYDPDRVLQLTEDTTTNFAVYTEEVILIDYVEGVNTVITPFSEEETVYIIDNADENFTTLQVGDIIAYPYGEEEILIIKVATITVEGTTVAITGDEIDLEEVFSQVKVEAVADMNNVTVDESVADEGVIYEGIVEDSESGLQHFTYGKDSSQEVSASKSFKMKIDKTVSGHGDSPASTKISGSIELKVKATLSFYVSAKRQYVSLKFEKTLKAAIAVTSKIEISIPLVAAKFAPIPGVSLKIEPEFLVEFEAEIEISATVSSVVGFSFEHKKGVGAQFKFIKSTPTVKTEIKGEIKLFLGIDLNPSVDIAMGALADFEISLPIGIEATAVDNGTNYDDLTDSKDTIHSCRNCLDISHCFQIELTFTLRFLKAKKLTFEKKYSLEISLPAFDMYYSVDNNKFGMGKCPYKAYLVTIQVKDENGANAQNITVSSNGNSLGKTNSKGLLTEYFKPGKYTVTAAIGETNPSKTVTVSKAMKIALQPQKSKKEVFIPSESTEEQEIVDPGAIVASGECGAEGSNITWNLNKAGLLSINGSGIMPDWAAYSNSSFEESAPLSLVELPLLEIAQTTDSTSTSGIHPWSEYTDLITSVYISPGITNIGSNAFRYCSSITSVTIPDSVAEIGAYAFLHCSSLTDVSIPNSVTIIEHSAFMFSGLNILIVPESVTSIDSEAFAYCRNLNSVVILGNLTRIGNSMFRECINLKSVSIPDTVTSIDYYAFVNCASLSEITIPNSVTQIGEGAFLGCKSLTSVSIPSNVLNIFSSAFKYCSGLEEISVSADNPVYQSIGGALLTRNGLEILLCPAKMSGTYLIPDGVQTIGSAAFEGCNQLVGISMPDSVTKIANFAFYGCSSLVNFEIPDTVTSIGHYAFCECSSLTNITIPEGITSIEWDTFKGCSSLTEIIIPNTVTSIGSSAFERCSSLTNIAIPEGITEINAYTFRGCSSLTEVNIPDDIARIGIYAFAECGNLESITVPEGITAIESGTFRECGSLSEIIIPATVESIGYGAFEGCSNLVNISIPIAVSSIDTIAFSSCTSLSNIFFEGNAPIFSDNVFWLVEAIAYYPADNGTWTSDVMQNYSGTITWVPYTLDEDGNMVTNEDAAVTVSAQNEEAPEIELTDSVISEEAPTLDAVYGGEYSTEETETYTLKKATFSGLVPGAEYLLLSMASIDTETPLEPENLLFIDQAAAGEDGTLTFTYVQRVTTDPSYVVACGAATKSLADAVITFPDMTADGELHAVDPTVVYDGVTLQEGRDYEITGTVSYTEAGTYVCYIRGIHNYTGTMKCTYVVSGNTTEPETHSVIRLSGKDRYLTAFAVANRLKELMGVPRFDTVIVAYGQNFPDALTGSYLAAVKNAPILLTEPNKDALVLDYISENLTSGGKVYILGGTAAVSENFENSAKEAGFDVVRLKGKGRYETNLEILKEAGVNETDEILIATGTNFADSLSASATKLPMLLVGPGLTAEQKDFLATTSRKFVIIGGTGAVNEAVEAELAQIGTVERIKGKTRYETSVVIAERYFTDPAAAVLAYAQGFPDGLCGGPLAMNMGAPLILTSNEAPTAADDYIEGITVGAVTGGTGRITDDTVRAIFDLAAETEIPKY